MGGGIHLQAQVALVGGGIQWLVVAAALVAAAVAVVAFAVVAPTCSVLGSGYCDLLAVASRHRTKDRKTFVLKKGGPSGCRKRSSLRIFTHVINHRNSNGPLGAPDPNGAQKWRATIKQLNRGDWNLAENSNFRQATSYHIFLHGVRRVGTFVFFPDYLMAVFSALFRT